MIDFLKNLNLNLKPIEYPKGVTIAYEGELCDKVRIIIAGRIRIISISSTGEEIIYKDLLRNDMFGNNLIFSKNPRYRGDIVVEETASIYEFSKDELIALLMSNKEFLTQYLMYQSEDSKKLNQTIKILSASSSEEKLLYLLQTSNNQIEIISITDLSKRLNLTREATSRVVHKLVKEGIISYKNKIIRKL